MRKLWYAGAAIASGFLLFAASPARADGQAAGAGSSTPSDLLPGNSIAPPVGDLLSGAGGYALTHGHSAVGHAVRGAKVAGHRVKNGLDRVRRATDDRHVTIPLNGNRPGTDSSGPASHRAPNRRWTEGLPSADVVGPLEPGIAFDRCLCDDDLFGQLALLDGVTADGQWQSFDSLEWPTESARRGVPLLGGLGGALPVEPGDLPDGDGTDDDVPDLSGLPGGGMDVLAPASAGTDSSAAAPDDSSAPDSAAPGSASSGSAAPGSAVPGSAAPGSAAPGSAAPHNSSTAAPAQQADKAKPAATPSTSPADPRLHEEPVGRESQRTFSPDGRPVAGIDPQYK